MNAVNYTKNLIIFPFVHVTLRSLHITANVCSIQNISKHCRAVELSIDSFPLHM